MTRQLPVTQKKLRKPACRTPSVDDTAAGGHAEEALEARVPNPSTDDTAADGHAEEALEAGGPNMSDDATAAPGHADEAPEAGAPDPSTGDRAAVEGSASDEAEAARGQSAAEAEPAASTVSAPMSEWDRRFDSVPIGAVVTLASDADLAAIGVTATATWGPVPDLCARLRS